MPRTLVLLLILGCSAKRPAWELGPAPGTPLAIAGGASSVALGDVDGDGRLDLVVAAGDSASLTVLRGDGSGRFEVLPDATLELHAPPGEWQLADLDGNGQLDLALASHDSYEVSVLLGDGRGRFLPAPGAPAGVEGGGEAHNHGLEVGDADEDGHPDLVTVQSSDECVALLLGDGRGGFARAPGSPVAVGPGPYPPALGDLDGDGHLDIVVPETGTGRYHRQHGRLAQTVTLLLGDGAGGFRAAPHSPLRVLDGPFGVALGDLDHDGTLDLVATHDDSERVTLLLNDGRGRFRPAQQSPLDLGRRAGMLRVADVDGDGRNDLVLATRDSLTVLAGDGHGRFAPAPGSPYPVGRGTWRFALGDIDGDGRLDVASAATEAGTVTVLLGR